MSRIYEQYRTSWRLKKCFLKNSEGSISGPVGFSTILRMTRDARISSGDELSIDKANWTSVVDIPELEMEWTAESGNVKSGPFNIHSIPRLVKRGVLDDGARLSNSKTGETRLVKDVLKEHPERAAPQYPKSLTHTASGSHHVEYMVEQGAESRKRLAEDGSIPVDVSKRIELEEEIDLIKEYLDKEREELRNEFAEQQKEQARLQERTEQLGKRFERNTELIDEIRREQEREKTVLAEARLRAEERDEGIRSEIERLERRIEESTRLIELSKNDFSRYREKREQFERVSETGLEDAARNMEEIKKFRDEMAARIDGVEGRAKMEVVPLIDQLRSELHEVDSRREKLLTDLGEVRKDAQDRIARLEQEFLANSSEMEKKRGLVLGRIEKAFGERLAGIDSRMAELAGRLERKDSEDGATSKLVELETRTRRLEEVTELYAKQYEDALSRFKKEVAERAALLRDGMRKEEELHKRIVEMETDRSLKRLDEMRELVREAGQETDTE